MLLFDRSCAHPSRGHCSDVAAASVFAALAICSCCVGVALSAGLSGLCISSPDARYALFIGSSRIDYVLRQRTVNNVCLFVLWLCCDVHNSDRYAGCCVCLFVVCLLVAELLERFDCVHCRHVVFGIANFAQSMDVASSRRSTKHLTLFAVVCSNV